MAKTTTHVPLHDLALTTHVVNMNIPWVGSMEEGGTDVSNSSSWQEQVLLSHYGIQYQISPLKQPGLSLFHHIFNPYSIRAFPFLSLLWANSNSNWTFTVLNLHQISRFEGTTTSSILKKNQYPLTVEGQHRGNFQPS